MLVMSVTQGHKHATSQTTTSAWMRCAGAAPIHKSAYGASIYDFRKKFGFFDPLPPPLFTYRNQLILFLLSAFWGPPPTTHCGRHIWKPPYGFTPTLFSNTYGFPVSNTALAHRSMLITEVTPLESVTFISKSRFPSPFQFQPKLSRGH